MKIYKLALLSLFLMSPMAFAGSACDCSASCAKECASSEHKNCNCDCGCKETGKCKHGKCHISSDEE